ncbi:MAG: hypothetical protein ABIW31_02910 [Novosphingobium sp.]
MAHLRRGGKVRTRTCTLSIGIFATLLLSISDGDAKGKPSPSAHRPQAVKPLTASQILAYNLVINRYDEREGIASSCYRSDSVGLIDALRRNSDWMYHEKGEFETTEQYENQKAQIQETMKSSGSSIFCKYLTDSRFDLLSYNSDKQTFSGYAPDSIIAKSVGKDMPSYRTTTRMGVPVTIHPYVTVAWEVNLSGHFDDACVSSDSSRKMVFSYPISNAALLKRTGRFGQLYT